MDAVTGLLLLLLLSEAQPALEASDGTIALPVAGCTTDTEVGAILFIGQVKQNHDELY